ncbi:hypothetical protein niasHT_001956 [Heterodera trifolii]|uniref:Uncharacterized protein n=1 Tax=Heterodera trifolii TaxID=157864 RepID=A0ABD2M347_9BILA
MSSCVRKVEPKDEVDPDLFCSDIQAEHDRDSLLAIMEEFTQTSRLLRKELAEKEERERRIRELETTVAQKNTQLQQNGTIIRHLREEVLEKHNQLETTANYNQQLKDFITRHGVQVPAYVGGAQMQGGGGQ